MGSVRGVTRVEVVVIGAGPGGDGRRGLRRPLGRAPRRRQHHEADHVVVATGYNHTPVAPDWPGLGAFTGEVVLARDYRNGRPFAGRDVLVVGQHRRRRLWFTGYTNPISGMLRELRIDAEKIAAAVSREGARSPA